MKIEGMPERLTKDSRIGLWDGEYSKSGHRRMVYGDDHSVRKGVAFLNTPEVEMIEDWGCGFGGVKLYIAPHQGYLGVDGSCSEFADIVADLEVYQSKVDGVFLRHVLEHNPNWSAVLDNAIASFTKRMVLVLFTPYQDSTRVLREYPDWEGSGHSMWDIGFRREDIISRFKDCTWTAEENLKTGTGYGVEHIFYLERANSGAQ